ncbi:MAG: Grx4 family monothiol glutaredoxin [Fidelibacterota bacterium]
MNLKEKIQCDILENPVILYMKGTPDMPMCGFSYAVVETLNQYDVEYKAVNILEDPEIRIKLSEISNWPTIPQLFVNGQLVGGCDITLELHQNGELEKIFNSTKSSAEE